MEPQLESEAEHLTWALQDLYAILDALPTPISWATIGDETIRYVNRAFTTTFGYEISDLSTVSDWIERCYVSAAQRDKARASWETIWLAPGEGIGTVSAFEIDVRCRNGHVITVQNRGILLHDMRIALAVFEDISAQKRVQNALKRIAFEDPLTGIANRRALHDAWTLRLVDQAGRKNCSRLALLLIDLDGFKEINDQWGHDAGDDVLKAVAARLQSSLGHHDMLCRIGGDEFAVLRSKDVSFAAVETLGHRIQSALSEPFKLAQADVSLSASIGASLYPQHGATLRELMRHADAALYQVKHAGKSSFAWYSAPATLSS